MKSILILNKREGETPLAALLRLRAKSKKYENIKMTYAGRLDPMASGVLLALLGEEIKNKEKYLALDKEYECEVLFGFATDTYDILGKITHSNTLTNIRIKDIIKNLKYFRGRFRQTYPLYSSRTVKGKPLWEYGRDEKAVELPTREGTIKKLKFLGIKRTNGQRLLSDIIKRIGKVDGDFRQKEILSIWRKKLAGKESANFYIAGFAIRSSSGTYVRAIAHALGERLGIPALAYRIKRTKVGKFAKIS